jgi:hypothetical protein
MLDRTLFSVSCVLKGGSPFFRAQKRSPLLFPILLSGRMDNSQNAKTRIEKERVASMSFDEVPLEKKGLCCPL